MELQKMLTMEQQEWPEGKGAYPREKHNWSTSLLKTPRSSPAEILKNVMVLEYFAEKRGNIRTNVTLKRVLVTVAAVKRKYVFYILSVGL
jgi:hypothetical protein